MKSMVVLALLSALLALVVARPEETYDARYDNFNAQELVESERLLKSYGKCFTDKGPCTAEGTEFKKIIPEALRTSCAKCTPKQKDLVRIVIRGFQTKLPDAWQEIIMLHDPEHKYKEAFEAFLNGSH